MSNLRNIKGQVKLYANRLKQGKLSKPSRCLLCKRKTVFYWHGSYGRDLIAYSQSFHLTIKRLLCTLCHHTFALLPDFVEKFCRYAKAVIYFALEKLKLLTYEAVAELMMEKTGQVIAPLTLFFWKRKFL